jgi:eukaryotic-like serine/threonine-protein kinase
LEEQKSGARFGRYELVDTLGEGGFATVYLALDTALERQVALKALLPHLAKNAEVKRRFLAEGRAIARLRHPNIVTIHDVGEEDGRPFYTMELIEGQTLAELTADGRRLKLAEVMKILEGLCSAVDYLHAAGLVHRDIKPSNVMLDHSDRVVLMDFGIARSLDETQYTRTGATLGTPEYMAPEQIRGMPAGPPADIYAIGILAYQLLAGRPPFVGDTAYVLHAQAYEPLPPLSATAPGLPRSVYAAIEAALAKDPSERFGSALQFRAEFARPSVPEARTEARTKSPRSPSAQVEQVLPIGRQRAVRHRSGTKRPRGGLPAFAFTTRVRKVRQYSVWHIGGGYSPPIQDFLRISGVMVAAVVLLVVLIAAINS